MLQTLALLPRTGAPAGSPAVAGPSCDGATRSVVGILACTFHNQEYRSVVINAFNYSYLDTTRYSEPYSKDITIKIT